MKFDDVRGAMGMATLVVRPGDTSVAQAHNDLPVLDPTTLTNLMEGACSAALAEHFGPGETSITQEIVIAISGTVGVGAEVRAHATCVEIEESILDFNVEVHHGARLIASANITRKVVDRVTYMARIAAETMMSEAG
jgi:predicted thioesterase